MFPDGTLVFCVALLNRRFFLQKKQHNTKSTKGV